VHSKQSRIGAHLEEGGTVEEESGAKLEGMESEIAGNFKYS